MDIPDDLYLRCPRCTYEQWVSPEDPDASQSSLVDHFRSRHPDEGWSRLLVMTEQVQHG